jgi:transcription antitermination factor NusG
MGWQLVTAMPNSERRVEGWQLVMAMPNSESRIEETLDHRHIPNHVFRFLSRRVTHHKRFDVKRPIFPGYIFVSAEDRWAEVKAIKGIFDFVRIGREIAQVDRYLVNLLKLADEDDVIPSEEHSKPRLKFGDKIFVKIGDTVCSAQFQRYAKNDRALVVLSGKFPAVVYESQVIGNSGEMPSCRSEPRMTGVELI